MTLRSDWSERPCSIVRGIDTVGDPSTLLNVRERISGVRRFDEMRAVVDVSDNVLANRLDDWSMAAWPLAFPMARPRCAADSSSLRTVGRKIHAHRRPRAATGHWVSGLRSGKLPR